MRRNQTTSTIQPLNCKHMHPNSYYIINGITYYRLIMAPVLLVLIFSGHYKLFGILLPISFFTDLIDGYLARKYHVESKRGAKLDSLADDINIFVAITAMFYFKWDFVVEEKIWITTLLVLYVLQTILALVRYRRTSSFHTYAAKIAALLQGSFFILLFLLPEPLYLLFYISAVATAIDLLEEIILVLLLPKWKADVKGLYWVMQKKDYRKV